MIAFETTRLLGIPLTPENYGTFANGLEPDWDGFTNPYRHLVEGPNPLPHRIPRVENDPSFADIGIILAVLKSTREIIGSAGFHDFPNEQGMIEVGYGIVDQMQGQGFGQEFLLGMWRMIIQRDDVKILRYTVAPDNGPSVHIVEKFGFVKVGEQIDPEDGLELIYELSSEEFRQRFD